MTDEAIKATIKPDGECWQPEIEKMPREQLKQLQVKKLKDKSVPEDEVKQVEKEIQDITDKFIGECDQIFAAKEKEIMTV